MPEPRRFAAVSEAPPQSRLERGCGHAVARAEEGCRCDRCQAVSANASHLPAARSGLSAAMVSGGSQPLWLSLGLRAMGTEERAMLARSGRVGCHIWSR